MQEFMNQLAVAFDLPILNWIQANLQSEFMDFIMPLITLFGEDGIFWIAWAVLLLIFPKTRKIGLGMGIALIMGLLICNVTLKPLIDRVRPYAFPDGPNDQEIYFKLLIDTLHDGSFPSGHTIASFEASVVLLKNSKKMGIPALIIAILVSFSRLYLFVHYPTDVITSVILGTALAFLGDWLAGKIMAKFPAKRGKFEA